MNNNFPAYINGQYLPLSKVSISPLDRGFLFGDGIYEVIPAFGQSLLELDAHLDRLASCLDAVQIPLPHSKRQWRDILQTLVNRCEGIDKKVYLQVTRGVQAERSHEFNGAETPTVFAMCSPMKAVSEDDIQRGVRVCSADDYRWKNCHLKTLSLLPNVLLKHTASQQQCAEAILLRDGRITEGSSSNVFLVNSGCVYTPPNSADILPGITRQVIGSLVRQLGLKLIEEEVFFSMIYSASELWITSSTRGVLAVSAVDDVTIGSGQPGPIWRQVYQAYEEMITKLRNAKR